MPLDLIPSRGFAVADYTYNLWTRSGGGQTGIADLARDTGNFTATAVPEPATWALLIAGFVLGGSNRDLLLRPEDIPELPRRAGALLRRRFIADCSVRPLARHTRSMVGALLANQGGPYREQYAERSLW